MFSTANFSFFSQKSEGLSFNPADVEEILNERESFDKNQKLSGTDKTETITDAENENIFSQLKSKLEVKKELSIDSQKLEKFWIGLSFKFSKPSSIHNEFDSDKFRVLFNPVDYSNLSCLDHELKESPGIINTLSVENESEKLEVLEESAKHQESSQFVEEEVSQIVLTKNIKALKDIFDEFDEKVVDDIKSKQPIEVQSNIFAAPTTNTDVAERLSSCVTKALALKSANVSKESEKITKIMLKNFFKSLSDEESENEADNIKNLRTISESLLSKSSKKVRSKTIGTPSEYNKVLGKIVKLDSQAKKSIKNFKENTPMNHQKPEEKKICFKDQVQLTPTNISVPPKIKSIPKLISNKTYEDLDKLSHRFKLDLQKPEPPPNTENLNQTNFSIFDMSKKLQLRASTSQATKKNLQRDGKIEKSKDESKSNMNINKYLNEFCRNKFTD